MENEDLKKIWQSGPGENFDMLTEKKLNQYLKYKSKHVLDKIIRNIRNEIIFGAIALIMYTIFFRTIQSFTGSFTGWFLFLILFVALFITIYSYIYIIKNHSIELNIKRFLQTLIRRFKKSITVTKWFSAFLIPFSYGLGVIAGIRLYHENFTMKTLYDDPLILFIFAAVGIGTSIILFIVLSKYYKAMYGKYLKKLECFIYELDNEGYT